MSCDSSLSLKRKEIQKKRNIKLKKIDKRKRKMLVSKAFYNKFGLIIEYSKTEIFHFNRLHGFFNSSLLDLSTIRGPTLHPKNLWKYLGFIFDRKLTFHQHINYYSNKAISIVKYMKLLGNLSQGITLIQKRLLYRCCVLPITLYGYVISQTLKHVRNMFNFNTTSNPHGYLVLFVSKYFIGSLVLYNGLNSTQKSVVILLYLSQNL